MAEPSSRKRHYGWVGIHQWLSRLYERRPLWLGCKADRHIPMAQPSIREEPPWLDCLAFGHTPMAEPSIRKEAPLVGL